MPVVRITCADSLAHWGLYGVSSDMHRMAQRELRHGRHTALFLTGCYGDYAQVSREDSGEILTESRSSGCENAGVPALDLSPGYGDFEDESCEHDI